MLPRSEYYIYMYICVCMCVCVCACVRACACVCIDNFTCCLGLNVIYIYILLHSGVYYIYIYIYILTTSPAAVSTTSSFPSKHCVKAAASSLFKVVLAPLAPSTLNASLCDFSDLWIITISMFRLPNSTQKVRAVELSSAQPGLTPKTKLLIAALATLVTVRVDTMCIYFFKKSTAIHERPRHC